MDGQSPVPVRLIHTLFGSRPTACAFAKKGQWEDAWLIPASTSIKKAELSAYLSGCHEVAFEIFCGDAFFGLRVEGSKEELELFALTALDSFLSAESGTEFVVAMTSAGYLSRQAKVKHIELGAVFAWRSVKAFPLPPAEVALATWSDWWPALRQSDLFRNTTRAKALELALDEDVEHWYGIPVAGCGACSEEGLAHALRAVLRSFAGDAMTAESPTQVASGGERIVRSAATGD